MGLFSNLSSQGLQETQDRLGGVRVIPTDIYTGKIKLAYAGAYKSNAQFIGLIFEHDGEEFKANVLIADKTGKNYFLNKQDNSKKVPLPGFTIMDDICVMLTDKPLCEQDTEEKTIKVYDFEAKAEVPKSAHVLVDLLDKEISLGIIEILKYKQVEDKSNPGHYVDTAEEVRENEIDKVYHTETKLTVVEARNDKTEGEFWDAWLAKNKGVVRDKRTKGGATAGAPKAAPQPGGNGAQTPASTGRTSLFKK